MDSLKFLITKIIVVIPFILLFGLMYFFFSKYVPNFSLLSPGGQSLSDLLPNPKNTPVVKPYVLELSGEKINGTVVGVNKNTNGGVSYVTVDKNGNLIYYKMNASSSVPNTAVDFQSVKKNYKDSDYVRNLSIFQNGIIYTNLTFTGEAKSTMFKDNILQMLVIDRAGRIIDVENILASKDWATPGWTRFYAKINASLPVRTPCALIFKPAGGSPDSYKNIYIQIPEMCN